MSNEHMLKVGGSVIYHDEVGNPHVALITALHCVEDERKEYPLEDVGCINVLWVSDDPNMTDNYGRQILRESSVCHAKCGYAAHGRYYRFEDEEPNIVKNSAT